MSYIQGEDRPIGQRGSDYAQNVNEDLRGATRRAEGGLMDDKGQQREHEQSTMERVGDKIKGAIGEMGAQKIGLKSDEDRRE